MRRTKESDQYWGLLDTQDYRVPDTVSYGKLYREVVRRMVGPYPPSLHNLFELLALRFRSTGG
jgi:hypothetical protein